MEIKEEINRCKKDKWFEMEVNVEVLAINQEVAESSLRKHIEKLSSEQGVVVYERKFSETQNVKTPLKDVEEAYSQVVNLKLFVKDISTLMYVVMLYGPSSIEILGPSKKDVSLSEVQHIANNLASLVHQFAAAGVGGIVITPEKGDSK